MAFRILLMLTANVFFLAIEAFAECGLENITPVKPLSVYTLHGDGTVTDNETGLMWQQCSLGLSGNDCTTGVIEHLLWQEVADLANNNTDYGYVDWRLPNKNELISLIDDSCTCPAFNSDIFPDVKCAPSLVYATSSVTPEKVWTVDFFSKAIGVTLRGELLYARLVRSIDR